MVSFLQSFDRPYLVTAETEARGAEATCLAQATSLCLRGHFAQWSALYLQFLSSPACKMGLNAVTAVKAGRWGPKDSRPSLPVAPGVSSLPWVPSCPCLDVPRLAQLRSRPRLTGSPAVNGFVGRNSRARHQAHSAPRSQLPGLVPGPGGQEPAGWARREAGDHYYYSQMGRTR